MKYQFLFFLCISTSLYSQSKLPIEPNFVSIAHGLRFPTHLTHAGDERLFVCELEGLILIIDEDRNLIRFPFLDIASKTTVSGEKGLLSMAFHPDYNNNGLFYVCYTNLDGDTQVSSFNVTQNNPDLAASLSEKKIITIPVGDAVFHMGGCLQFGPDGYLYISTGDAVMDLDLMVSQDGSSLLGKILRIDIDNGDPYSIPDDNPFVDDNNFRDEIWAYGLRNPWKFSFDKENGDMYIADVGANNWEEINYVASSEASGKNFGWPCFEANEEQEESNCNLSNHHRPEISYSHESQGNIASVTGGYVYRGLSQEIKDLGVYIFADFASNKVMASCNENSEFIIEDIMTPPDLISISAIGEDVNGELYVLNIWEGTVYLIDFRCNLPLLDLTQSSCTFSEDGCFEFSYIDTTNIRSLNLFNELDQLIPEDQYCNLPIGIYKIELETQDALCPQNTFFKIRRFFPQVRTTRASCLTSDDGCAMIEIPKLSDRASYRIESENGDVIDTSKYCQLLPGDYTFIVAYDLNDCTTREFTIRFPTLRYDIETISDTLFVTDSLETYQWLFIPVTIGDLGDEIEIPNANMHYYIPNLGTGLYRVIGVTKEGCEYTSHYKVIEVISNTTNLIINDNIKISPIPAQNVIHLEFLDTWPSGSELSILSINGKVLHHETFRNQVVPQKYSIDINSFDPGIYFFRAQEGSKQITTKFVKL